MTRFDFSPSITITLCIGHDEDGNDIERDLDCQYYVEEEDPSVGIFGTDIIVEDVRWDDDHNADVPEEIWEGRKDEIEELTRDALADWAESMMEP